MTAALIRYQAELKRDRQPTVDRQNGARHINRIRPREKIDDSRHFVR